MEDNKMMKSSDEEKEYSDDELIEDVNSDDDAPVSVIYRCKKCGQILSAGAKDCWKCSSKEIEEVVEEETKELRKVMLQARVDKLENDLKNVKKNNDFLYVLFAIMVVLVIVILISK